MMYRLLADSNYIASKRVYVLEASDYYSPEITMKIKMSHPIRKALKFTAGASNDTSATVPDKTHIFTALKNRGGDFPMTGTSDTIEFGLDITNLYSEVNNYEPTKIFISLNEKDTSDIFNGFIHNYSVLTYSSGVSEYACSDSNVVIVNNDLTRISVIIPGNGFYPPTNLASSLANRNIDLLWENPVSYPAYWNINAFKIYRNNEFITTISDTSIHSFTDINLNDGTYNYEVSCIYTNGTDLFESMPSNEIDESILLNPIAAAGNCLLFNGDDNYILGDSIDIAHKSFTMEFWTKKLPAGGDNMVVGHGQWGKGHKAMHYGFRNNNLYMGFYGDDISSDTAFLDNNWHHYAATFDTATYQQSLYCDGELINTRISDTTYYGIGPVYIGAVSNKSRYFRGNLDEIRIWDTLRTMQEIKEGMFFPPASNAPGLLAYWHFDEPMGNKCFDLSINQNNGILMNFDIQHPESDLWVYHNISPDSTLEVYAGYGRNNNSVSYHEIVAPINGTLNFDTQSNRLSYTPLGNWIGYDSLAYFIDDGITTDTVNLYINAGNFPTLNSPEISSTINNDDNFFSVYPNPSANKIYISINGKTTENSILKIYDISGNLIHKKKTSSFQNNFEFDFSSYSEGSYLIEISNKQFHQTKKLVIIR